MAVHIKQLWLGVFLAPLVVTPIVLWGNTTEPDPIENTCTALRGGGDVDETRGGQRERDALVLAVTTIQRAMVDGKDRVAVEPIVRAVAEAQNIVAAVPTLHSLENALEPALHEVDDTSAAWSKGQAAIRILNDRLDDFGGGEG